MPLHPVFVSRPSLLVSCPVCGVILQRVGKSLGTRLPYPFLYPAHHPHIFPHPLASPVLCLFIVSLLITCPAFILHISLSVFFFLISRPVYTVPFLILTFCSLFFPIFSFLSGVPRQRDRRRRYNFLDLSFTSFINPTQHLKPVLVPIAQQSGPYRHPRKQKKSPMHLGLFSEGFQLTDVMRFLGWWEKFAPPQKLHHVYRLVIVRPSGLGAQRLSCLRSSFFWSLLEV